MYLLEASAPETFPPVELASPEGLLAVGGDLKPARLLAAYRRGIFPWYNPGQPILWWSPDPRAVLYPRELRFSRTLKKTLRQGNFTVTLDRACAEVIRACAHAPRAGAAGTWITPEMIDAYVHLHEMGIAHSCECWRDDRLAGGLYGVALGGVFFGESMFSTVSNASKVALAHLVRQLERWGFALIDCQLPSEHLKSLGARDIPRRAFIQALAGALNLPAHPGAWKFDADLAIIESGPATDTPP